MKKFCTILAAVALIAAIVTACGGSDGSGETTETATGAQTASATSENPTATGGAAITIENMAFGESLTVAPGARITVANMDTVEHSVTSRTAGAFDVHVDGKQKGTLIAPAQPGEYQFYCVYHPTMTGTLIVE
jgi:plastocyanin